MKDLIELLAAYPLWVKIAILVLQTIVVALLVFGRGIAPSQTSGSTNRAITADSGGPPHGGTNEQPAPRPALLVTFADMTRGRVEFSTQFQVIAQKAPLIVANFGSYQSATDAIQGFLEGKVRDELVKHTLVEARLHRSTIAEQIRASAGPELEERYWHKLHRVVLGEIWPLETAQPAAPADAAPPRR